MKKFKFELEPLLDLRQAEQDQAQIELGKAIQAEAQIQAGLDSLARQYVSVKKQIDGQSDFNALSSAQQFFSFIRQEQERLMEEMAQAKIVTEQRRAAFSKAMQKAEALKNLKDSQKEEYREAVKKEEAKILDDVVTFKYN